MEPAAESSQKQVSSNPQDKPFDLQKPRKTYLIWIALGILVLLTVGVAGYSLGAKNLENKTSLTTTSLIGGDKDEHGCLIGAGYTWCEEKNKCLRTWEEPCEVTESASAVEEDLRAYTSEDAKISFVYPADWTINEQYEGVTSNFIDINSDSMSIRIEYGEIGGRGGPCVKRMITYKGNVADDKLSLVRENDVLSEDTNEYCGMEELKGYAFMVEQFTHGDKGYFIYSIDSEDTAGTEEAIDNFEKIVSSIKFTN